jgi:hypothetical protein
VASDPHIPGWLTDIEFSRIDPRGCGCTDCLTGYSKPLDVAAERDIDRMLDGGLVDATGMDWAEVEERMEKARRQARDEAIREYASRLRD